MSRRPTPAHPAPLASTLRTARALALAMALALAAAASAQPTPELPLSLALETAEAAPGRLVEATWSERWSAEEVQRRAGPVFGAYGPPRVENAVDLWQLRFHTTDLDGSVATVAAQAFTPVASPRGAPPLLVYGSGTTGVAARCAPSRERELPAPLGAYRELLAPFAARGIAVVLPDYLGFDDPARPQAYFVAEAEARVMLDAARAVGELYARFGGLGPLRPDVVAAGYSQGGHAAFAAADRRSEYAPDVALRGVVGFAATTDVAALLATAAYYAPYVLLAYRSTYGAAIDPAQVLAPRFLANLEREAGSICVDGAQRVYPYDGASAYATEFHRALQAGAPEVAAPAFARALAMNATGLSGHGLPAMLVQGGQDVIVRDATQQRFAARLCAAGSAVAYVQVALARHRDTRPAGFEPAVAWVWGRVAQEPAPTTCTP